MQHYLRTGAVKDSVATPTTTPTATTPSASDAALLQIASEVKAELKQIASEYKAQCMALELVVNDYMRRRFAARTAAVKRRVGATESFLMLTYGRDLLLRLHASRPHVPEPLAIIVITEGNGAIVNMDETTCITQSQLETIVATEHGDSPTVELYRALNAAFNSDQLNLRKQVVVMYVERGRYQDMGQNVRLMLFVDANYGEMERIQNDILAKHAQPGQPTTIADLLLWIKKQSASTAAPAT